MLDKLVDIPKKDLLVLRSWYQADWPKHSIGYGVLDNYIRWLNQDSNIPHLRICSLNGDWRDGTFIIMDWNVIFVNTLNKDFNRLSKLLSLVDFSRRPVISSVESKVFNAVCKFVADQGIDYYSAEVKWHRLPKADAEKLNVRIPEGMKLRQITEADIETINQLWPHKYPGSLTFLKRLAKYNISYGVVAADGELAAWCLRLPSGGLGMLQVVEPYKRKGLGTLMAKVMATSISEKGYDVFTPIDWYNQPSLQMFGKIGFTEIDTIYWFLPKIYGHWEDY